MPEDKVERLSKTVAEFADAVNTGKATLPRAIKAKSIKAVDSISCHLEDTDSAAKTGTGMKCGNASQGAPAAEKQYRFTVLETPVSANRYWRVAGNRIYVSKEAEAFKHIVAWEAKRAGVPCISDRPVEVKIYYYHQHPKRRLDVDNILKCGIDSLAGVAFDNDKRVVRVSAECWHDAEHPRLTFEITYRDIK